MRGYNGADQETALDGGRAYRSPHAAAARPGRPRRYSAGAGERHHRRDRSAPGGPTSPYSDDQKVLMQYPCWYGSVGRRTRPRPCPDQCMYCCCEDDWYRYYGGDVPPCPPAPASSHPALYHEPQLHRAYPLPVSRSRSRELRPNGVGAAPFSQRGRPPDTESDPDDEEVVIANDCHCACDHTGTYRQLKEEDSTQFPPDVTQPNKEEVTFYPRHPPSTTSTSTTTGCALVSDLLSAGRARHRWLVGVAVLLAAAAGVGVPLALSVQAGDTYEQRLESANKLLTETPLIDGHNDLPWNIRKFVHNRLNEFRFGEDLRQVPPWSMSAWSHTDLQRLRAGRVAAQFWAAYVPCESQFKDAVQLTLEQIDVVKRLTDKYHPPLTYCTSAKEISEAHSRGEMCSLVGVEGGHSLANSLPVLRMLYGLGVRYLTLTSTCNTQWADSSQVELPGKKAQHGGLTNFGKIVVKEMNRLGMIVDLSHVSLSTMKAALEVSKAPVVFSHSSARALCNSSRNVPDNVLASLGLNGGLVMVNFYSQFLTCKDTATVADAVAHINHIRNIAGVDSVGLGAGYDGINFTPKGLEDVASYPTLFAELIGTGLWTVDDLKKLAGLNFLRVMRQVEKVRDEMARSGVEPYEDTISPRYLKGRSNCTSQDPF